MTGRMKEIVDHYGDVVLGDATYKTNDYKYPLFLLCVKVPTGRYSIVFAALLDSEDIDSYVWLFNIFKNWIAKDPICFMLDRLASYNPALDQTFPNSVRLYCRRHLQSNFDKHLSHQSRPVATSLSSAFYRLMNVDSFSSFLKDMQSLIDSLVSQKANSAINWITSQFSPIIETATEFSTKHRFHNGIVTTSPSEGLNHALKISYGGYSVALGMLFETIDNLSVTQYMELANFKVSRSSKQYTDFVTEQKLLNVPPFVLQSVKTQFDLRNNYSSELFELSSFDRLSLLSIFTENCVFKDVEMMEVRFLKLDSKFFKASYDSDIFTDALSHHLNDDFTVSRCVMVKPKQTTPSSRNNFVFILSKSKVVHALCTCFLPTSKGYPCRHVFRVFSHFNEYETADFVNPCLKVVHNLFKTTTINRNERAPLNIDEFVIPEKDDKLIDLKVFQTNAIKRFTDAIYMIGETSSKIPIVDRISVLFSDFARTASVEKWRKIEASFRMLLDLTPSKLLSHNESSNFETQDVDDDEVSIVSTYKDPKMSDVKGRKQNSDASKFFKKKRKIPDPPFTDVTNQSQAQSDSQLKIPRTERVSVPTAIPATSVSSHQSSQSSTSNVMQPPPQRSFNTYSASYNSNPNYHHPNQIYTQPSHQVQSSSYSVHPSNMSFSQPSNMQFSQPSNMQFSQPHLVTFSQRTTQIAPLPSQVYPFAQTQSLPSYVLSQSTQPQPYTNLREPSSLDFMFSQDEDLSQA